MLPVTDSNIQVPKINNSNGLVLQNPQFQLIALQNNTNARLQTRIYPISSQLAPPINNIQCLKEKTSQKAFDDDDEIESNLELAKKDLKMFDLNKQLICEIKTLHKMIKLSETQTQYRSFSRDICKLPGIISIKTKDLTNDQDLNRIGVDLICLIDRSSSMNGQKMQTVKSSLKVLLNYLTDQDRLQLIIFNHSAQRLTPLRTTTQNNKQYIYFLSIVDQIYSEGGTDIASATEIAFQQLKGRKYRNAVSSIFLLSDGQDNAATQLIQTQLQQMDEEFTLHSFGFGEDHDANMMTSICNLKHGSFYFVQNITLLDEFFVDAFGGLKSVVGEKLQITVNLKPPEILKDLKIFKTYGNMWINKENHYEIDLPVLIQGSRKDFVFELQLPCSNEQIQDNQRNPQIMEVQLQITDPISKNKIQKFASLVLTIFHHDEQINQNEEDIEVLAQYNRVIAAQVIDDARKSCQQEKYKEAQSKIDSVLVLLIKTLIIYYIVLFSFDQQNFKQTNYSLLQILNLQKIYNKQDKHPINNPSINMVLDK